MKKVIATVLCYLSTSWGRASSCEIYFHSDPWASFEYLLGLCSAPMGPCKYAAVATEPKNLTAFPLCRGARDFWPYLGLLLWLSYPWSYLKEDEIWQVPGLAKPQVDCIPGCQWEPPPRKSFVSTFKSVQFICCPLHFSLTCRANLAQCVDRWSWTFVSCWPAFPSRYVSSSQPLRLGFKQAWPLGFLSSHG